MLAQYKKELRSYMYNMIGVTFVALILVLTGIFATVYNFKGGYPLFEYTLSGVTFMYFLAVPILTMRSLSDEKSQKTDQLLYSLPVGMPKIIIGKYLAMVTVNLIPVLVMAFYPIILSGYGEINFLSSYNAIFGFFLLGCALIAIGMFISSLTESVVLSAVITFGAFILLYLLQPLAMLIPETAAASLICFIVVAIIIAVIVYILMKNSTIALCVGLILSGAAGAVCFANPALYEGLFTDILVKLAIFDRVQTFIAYEMFDLSGVVYYLSIIALFIFLTVRSVEKKRWS